MCAQRMTDRIFTNVPLSGNFLQLYSQLAETEVARKLGLPTNTIEALRLGKAFSPHSHVHILGGIARRVSLG